jgi:NitT/TauT family transport system substrate-binding protein
MPHSLKSRSAFLTTLAAATGVPLSARKALGQTSDLIRVGIGPSDQVSPMVYAGDAGIYKKYGLNVEIVLLPTGNALLTAVAGGSLELTMSSSLAAITAISRGVPLTVIGNLSLYNSTKPDLAMLVLKDSDIHSAKDLEGKTLSGVALQDINTMSTNAWLDKLGVDRSTIKYVEIPASATLAAMEQGRIVASTVYEPFYSQIMATGKARVLGYPLDAISSRFSSGLLSGTKTWVDAHRDAVQKFLRALGEADAYISAHESESAAVMGKFLGRDMSSIANIHHAERTVAITPGDVQPVIDAALKYKVIPSSIPAADMLWSGALRR